VKKLKELLPPGIIPGGHFFCAQMGEILGKYPLAILFKLISGRGKTKPPATRTGGSAYQQKGKDETSNHVNDYHLES